jgi:protease-4
MFKAIYKTITGILDFIKRYFFILLVLGIGIAYLFNPQNEKSTKANLMRIDIVGPILQSDTFLKKIDEASKNNIKGVLVYINSPGGLVAPSVEMSYAIKRLKNQKPVVVYAAGTMASGSYYAGIWADKIVANPGAIIGSIGVIFDGFNISELAKKLGIKEQTIKMGKYKEAGTFLRAWNKDEKEELDRVLKDTYDMFVADVARARELKLEDRDKFADAHIFTANRAKFVGLVDEVGTIYNAEQDLIKLSGVVEPKWKKRDKYEKYLDKLLSGAISKVSSYFGGLQSYMP